MIILDDFLNGTRWPLWEPCHHAPSSNDGLRQLQLYGRIEMHKFEVFLLIRPHVVSGSIRSQSCYERLMECVGCVGWWGQQIRFFFTDFFVHIFIVAYHWCQQMMDTRSHRRIISEDKTILPKIHEHEALPFVSFILIGI